MRQGPLRYRVDIQTATEAADSAGQLVKTWATLHAAVPMELVQQRGTEGIRGKQVEATGNLIMRCRYRAGVTPANRVIWNATAYEVQSVDDPDGKQVEQLLTVTEQR